MASSRGNPKLELLRHFGGPIPKKEPPTQDSPEGSEGLDVRFWPHMGP